MRCRRRGRGRGRCEQFSACRSPRRAFFTATTASALLSGVQATCTTADAACPGPLQSYALEPRPVVASEKQSQVLEAHTARAGWRSAGTVTPQHTSRYTACLGMGAWCRRGRRRARLGAPADSKATPRSSRHAAAAPRHLVRLRYLTVPPSPRAAPNSTEITAAPSTRARAAASSASALVSRRTTILPQCRPHVALRVPTTAVAPQKARIFDDSTMHQNYEAPTVPLPFLSEAGAAGSCLKFQHNAGSPIGGRRRLSWP
jgi:hypothetical protein